MKWKKLGLVRAPTHLEWVNSHAQNPFVEYLEGSRVKVHVSTRDAHNMANGSWLELDLRDPLRVIGLSPRPTLSRGRLGCFDDCGVMPSSIVEVQGTKYLYYTGWTRTVLTPFSFHIGLAISQDGGCAYHRVSEAPVLGRSQVDPLITAAPWVLKEDGTWKMWYVSATKWVQDPTGGKLKHYYHIRYCESSDGISWYPEGLVCIDFENDEYALARPVVYKRNDTYCMTFAARGGNRSYSIGYAESQDGIRWQRMDRAFGLLSRDFEWESEMLCYACPISVNGKLYVFYNGNNYGEQGFGIAVSEH